MFWALVCELLKISTEVLCFIAEVAVSRQHELISSDLLVNHLYLVTVSIYTYFNCKTQCPLDKSEPDRAATACLGCKYSFPNLLMLYLS